MQVSTSLKGKSGIYKILNKVDGKVYVGKTSCFYKRFHQHKYSIKYSKLKTINTYLLNAINKYGFDNFSFIPIEYCNIEALPEKELFWMNHYSSLDKNKGYNLRSDTEKGMQASESTKRKLSKTIKRQWADGMRDGHSNKMKARWKNDEKGRAKQSSVMSKALTRYKYIIDDNEDVLYSELVHRGLKNVLGKFFETKKDRVVFKGHIIERVKL